MGKLCRPFEKAGEHCWGDKPLLGTPFCSSEAHPQDVVAAVRTLERSAEHAVLFSGTASAAWPTCREADTARSRALISSRRNDVDKQDTVANR